MYLEFDGDSICFEVFGVEEDAVNKGLGTILVWKIADVSIL